MNGQDNWPNIHTYLRLAPQSSVYANKLETALSRDRLYTCSLSGPTRYGSSYRLAQTSASQAFSVAGPARLFSVYFFRWEVGF